MAHWDEDSAQLRRNLRAVESMALVHARERLPITLDALLAWHARMMEGLDIPRASIPARPDGTRPSAKDFFGRLRGSSGLEHVDVEVRPGGPACAPPWEVADACREFMTNLQQECKELDARIARGSAPHDLDDLQDVIEVVAWAHNEWIRIHPFGNGNGRTARLLANTLLVRYGLPRLFELRPRPADGYAMAADRGMNDDDEPLERLIRWWLLQRWGA